MHKALYIDHFAAIASPTMRHFVAEKNLNEALSSDLDFMLGAANYCVFIAELEGQPCAYGTGYTKEERSKTISRRGYIEDWYVDAKHRGEGIGKRIIDELENYFRACGCTMVESATWAFNKNALNAHRKLGYEDARVILRKML